MVSRKYVPGQGRQQTQLEESTKYDLNLQLLEAKGSQPHSY